MNLREKICQLDMGDGRVSLYKVLKILDETDFFEPLRFEEMALVPKAVMASDHLKLTISESDGNRTTETVVYDKTIGRPMLIDSAAIFWIEDSLDYKQMICGGFGEKRV